jgi:hypothetical protein
MLARIAKLHAVGKIQEQAERFLTRLGAQDRHDPVALQRRKLPHASQIDDRIDAFGRNLESGGKRMRFDTCASRQRAQKQIVADDGSMRDTDVIRQRAGSPD